MIINTNNNSDNLSGSMLATLEGDVISTGRRRNRRPLSVLSGNPNFRNPNAGFTNGPSIQNAFDFGKMAKTANKYLDRLNRFLAAYPEFATEGEMSDEGKAAFATFQGLGAAASAAASTTKASQQKGSSGSHSITIAPNPGTGKLSVYFNSFTAAPGKGSAKSDNQNQNYYSQISSGGAGRIIDLPLFGASGKSFGSRGISKGGAGSGGASLSYDTGLDLYPTKEDYSGYFRKVNRMKKIPLKRVMSFSELQGVREYLKGILIDNELLGETEVQNMNDAELLGFFKKLWKGIKKVGTGIWKGVKSAGKWIGKTAGKVGKGIWNVAKKVGTGLYDATKWVGKNLWEGVKKLGSGVLAIGKFVYKNAIPILKAGLSLIPGGGVIAGMLDMLDAVSQPQEDQQPQEEMQQPEQMPQEQQAYVPQEQYEIPQEEYTPQEQYAQYEEIPQQQNYELPQEPYSQTEESNPTIYVDESGNYFDEAGNQIFVDENGEMYYAEETMSGENIFKKIGNILNTKIIKPVTKFVNDPVKVQSALNRAKVLNEARISTDAKLSQQDLIAQMERDAIYEQAKINATGKGFMESYGMWVVVGAAALMLIIANNKN